ncbi:MAG: acylphosphatase [Verrucomicrobiota bacterium]|nr:acylphosphatase [Verrucomicrobiota bacterium]
MMRPVILLIFCLFLPLSPLLNAREIKLSAVTGTATGDVQKVGFRAHIFKAAIRYNLAGTVNNNPDGSVSFTLQGDSQGVKKTLKEVGEGSKHSQVSEVTSQPSELITGMNTFTVYGWTSHTRDISTPYNLVFTLRSDDSLISEKNAKKVYYQILENTLQGEDKDKIKKHRL